MLLDANATIELYDLSNDPGEKNNLSNTHPNLVKKMETILKIAQTPSEIFTFGDGTYLNEK